MSSPIARCPRCGHHSRFDGRAGSVVRCSCGAELVLSEVGLPPLGTRFGDLSPEQRAALPVGTKLTLPMGELPGRWFPIPREASEREAWAESWPDDVILAYPEPEPDPRDSDGPGSDEGGGEMRTGDNDPGRGPAWRCSCGYGYPLGHPRCPKCCRYPVRDCKGAEDAPRDCLPG